MQTFERLESEVRGYCRSFPVVFEGARGSRLFAEDGREFLDFFSGAGALNYGHNPPDLRRALLDYLSSDAPVHMLDLATVAKRSFLERFEEVILRPRGLDYKVQFPGPTGTNAVEAALKLARKVKGRPTVLGFTHGFHGMTLGSLAVTSNAFKRKGAGVPLSHAFAMPFDGSLGPDVDTLAVLRSYLEDAGSGLDEPAAVIVETVQGEGGVHTARGEWLVGLEQLCREHDVLLIVDDIQAGCGRTGRFFSFEEFGIEPDIVCLSKSLSGYGLPLAVTLFRPELDLWEPGEHNGTFRGHNPAFVTATAALEYWRDDSLSLEVQRKERIVTGRLRDLASKHESLGAEVRGRGLLQGLALSVPDVADQASARAFENGLIFETSGATSNVIKLMPPLVIPDDDLERGLDILAQSLASVL